MARFDLDDEEGFEGPAHTRLRRLAPPRRDAVALGFGAAFIVFGVLGLLRAAGAPVPEDWLYPAILIGLGGVGLGNLALRGR